MLNRQFIDIFAGFNGNGLLLVFRNWNKSRQVILSNLMF